LSPDVARIVLTFLASVFVLCAVAGGQPATEPRASGTPPQADASPSAPIEAEPPRRVEEAPAAVFLKDKDGRLVPMYNWTLEELDRLYGQTIQTQDEQPSYVVQSLAASGTARRDFAELTIHFEIRIRDSEGCDVPLGLDEALLRAPPKVEGAQRHVVRLADEGSGYHFWLEGDPAVVHRLSLDVLVPLTRVGEETRIKLSVPRATFSSLKLRVPLPAAVGEIEGRPITSTKTSDAAAASEFTILGLSPNFELAWRNAAAETASTQQVLEAIGLISAKLNGRAATSDVRLFVHALEPLSTFTIRLPEGVQPTLASTSDYTLIWDAENRLIRVEPARPITNWQEIRVTTAQVHPEGEELKRFELGGIEIPDAVRQFGYVAVEVPDDARCVWGPRRDVRQIETLDVDRLPEEVAPSAEALAQSESHALFEYFNQPCSLTARVIPKQVRAFVEPEYLLQVDPHLLKLRATFRYAIRGGEEDLLSVQLGDWSLERVEPDGVVAADDVAVNDSGVLLMPLVRPTRGNVEITVWAHRRLEPGSSRIVCPLPKARAETLGPASLIVAAAENIDLSPVLPAMEGLTAEPAPPSVAPLENRQPPLFFRGEADQVTFAADIEKRERDITVGVRSSLDLARSEPVVEQTFNYTIAHERAGELLIEVPGAVDLEDLVITLDGSPLTLTEPSGSAHENAAAIRRRAVLPSLRIGRCELLVRYPIRLPNLQIGKPVAAAIPLVMPLEGRLLANTLEVKHRPGVAVRLRAGTWEPAPAPSGGSDLLHFAAKERAGGIPLEFTLQDPKALGSTTVYRAWIQTWVTVGRRTDRAVFQFASDQKEIDLTIPAGVDSLDVAILLDNQSAQSRPLDGRRLKIVLPSAPEGALRQLETWYHFAKVPAQTPRRRIELPHLGPDVWVYRTYWQLVLPQNEHVIVPPEGFFPEYRWGWNGAFWARIPLMEQRELEAWSGGPQQTAVPSTTSRYLFSALGPVATAELRTASRPIIVLLASGIALIGALLLIYVPALRHPAVLLPLAAALAAISMIKPDVALLAAEAAALGVALSVIAAMLHRSMSRHRGAPGGREPSSSVLNRRSTQSLRPRPPITGPSPGEVAQVPASSSVTNVQT
jgi:hypothetical protein